MDVTIGVTIGPSETMKEKVLRVELSKAKPAYSDGCVKTCEDFKTGLVGMTEDELRPWFARIKLRYSCSSIAVAFVRIVVPGLIQRGTSFCCVCLGTPKPAEILKRCMRCKAVLYCGKTCQRYDWGRRKAECKA